MADAIGSVEEAVDVVAEVDEIDEAWLRGICMRRVGRRVQSDLSVSC